MTCQLTFATQHSLILFFLRTQNPAFTAAGLQTSYAKVARGLALVQGASPKSSETIETPADATHAVVFANSRRTVLCFLIPGARAERGIHLFLFLKK